MRPRKKPDESPIGGQPLWYQGRDHLRAPRPRVLRQQRRRHRRLSRASPRSSTTCRTSASRRSGCCRSIRRRCGTTATTSPTTPACIPSYGTLRGLPSTSSRGASARAARHHRARAQPHLRPAPLVPAGPARAGPAAPARDFYVWSDTPDKYQDARIIFKDFEASNWTWDPVANAYFWHRFYSPPARPELRQPARCSTPDLQRRSISGWSMGVDGLRLDAIPYLYERDGTNCENLPGDARVSQGRCARHIDAQFHRPDAAGGSQPVARGRGRLLRRRRRVPHGLPLPADAAAVHGVRMEDRFPIVDILAQTPAIPETASGRCFCATTTS